MNSLKISEFRFGKFFIVDKIGTGGMSEVYLAKLKGPHGYEKVIVLKLLLPHLAYDESFINMLTDEALIVSKLNHPNIVQVYEFGRIEERYYICMEYVEGPNLCEFIKRFGEVPDEVSIFILIEVLKGLHYAHTAKDEDGIPLNVVHRDISPQNILIRRDGVVKLTDFGIAKARGRLSLTRSGYIKGKYRYMSPEQVEGKGIDYRSDIFSTGVLAYELATGRHLFEGEELQVIRKIREMSPEDIKEVNKEWFDLFKECLHRDRARRPSAYTLRRTLLERYQAEYLKGEERIKEMLENWSFPERVKKAHSIFSTITKPVNNNRRRFFYAFLIPMVIVSVFSLFYISNRDVVKRELRVKDNPSHGREEKPIETVKNEVVENTGYGFLTLNTEPWTHVFIDGKNTGFTTPLVNLKIRAGKHTLRLVNMDYGIDKVMKIEIKKNRRLKIKKRLRSYSIKGKNQ